MPPLTYRHYKTGDLYEVITDAAKHSETLERLVVYKRVLGSNEIWVRPHSMFFGNVTVNGREVYRFTFVS